MDIDDPIVVAAAAFWNAVDALRCKYIDEILYSVSADFIEEVTKFGRPLDDVMKEFEHEVIRTQKKSVRIEQRAIFQNLEKLTQTPDITPLELGHIVAKDFYLQNQRNKNPYNLDVKEPLYQTLSKSWDQLYDNTYSSKIRERSIRAAKELFGK